MTFLLLCRPYHTLLFLVDEKDILDSLSTDASPALRRLVRHSSPLKSFRTLGRGALNLKVTEDSAKLKNFYSRFLLATVMRIRVREPEFGAFLTSGSGSGMGKNPDHFSESLETVFWVKILKFFHADLDLDPGWKNLDQGFGINIQGSATLEVNTSGYRIL